MYNQYSLTQVFVMTSGDGLEIYLPLLLPVSCGVRMVSDFLKGGRLVLMYQAFKSIPIVRPLIV